MGQGIRASTLDSFIVADVVTQDKELSERILLPWSHQTMLLQVDQALLVS